VLLRARSTIVMCLSVEAADYGGGRPANRVWFPARTEWFFFSQTSDLLWDPHFLLYKRYQLHFPRDMKLTTSLHLVPRPMCWTIVSPIRLHPTLYLLRRLYCLVGSKMAVNTVSEENYCLKNLKSFSRGYNGRQRCGTFVWGLWTERKMSA
jgi:hypothetical protein